MSGDHPGREEMVTSPLGHAVFEQRAFGQNRDAGQHSGAPRPTEQSIPLRRSQRIQDARVSQSPVDQFIGRGHVSESTMCQPGPGPPQRTGVDRTSPRILTLGAR